MNEEEYFEQLCSNSVDGTLTDSEKQKLEEHLAECPSCAALKEDLEQMHSMLAVDETEPPAGLHDSIMERLRQEETVRVVAPQKPMRRLPVFTMVAAAAVVVLVVLGGGLMPAFSTVGSGSTAAADSASADAGDCTVDGGMQDEIGAVRAGERRCIERRSIEFERAAERHGFAEHERQCIQRTE